MASDQYQEPYQNPTYYDNYQQEEEESYPYQYPTYPSQYTPYNAEFISPSVTPAPHTVDSRSSVCSTPPPVPSFPLPGNWGDDHEDHGSINQNYYSSRGMDLGNEEMIYSRPLPATPVSPPPQPKHIHEEIAPVGLSQVETQRKGLATVDVEKIGAAPTTGGAFVTVFGKRYNKRPVIIIGAILIVLVIIGVALGAGLGTRGGGDNGMNSIDLDKTNQGSGKADDVPHDQTHGTNQDTNTDTDTNPNSDSDQENNGNNTNDDDNTSNDSNSDQDSTDDPQSDTDTDTDTDTNNPSNRHNHYPNTDTKSDTDVDSGEQETDSDSRNHDNSTMNDIDDVGVDIDHGDNDSTQDHEEHNDSNETADWIIPLDLEECTGEHDGHGCSLPPEELEELQVEEEEGIGVHVLQSGWKAGLGVIRGADG